MHRYVTYNDHMPTTGALAGGHGTVNGTKTFLQLALPSTRQLQVISWGFSMSARLAGTVDLCQQDVGDTVVQTVAADIYALDPNAPASLLDLSSTTKTGINASAQGTPTATRMLDSQILSPTSGDNELNYSYQFMPDERPIVAVSKFIKVRGTFSATTANVQCWICWDE